MQSIFCEPCLFLSLTEKEQNELKESKQIFVNNEHRCERFNKKVYHYKCHPKLLRLSECIALGEKPCNNSSCVHFKKGVDQNCKTMIFPQKCSLRGW